MGCYATEHGVIRD